MSGVREALDHSVLLLVAAAVCWIMAHNPERTFQAFTFRPESGPRMLVSFLRLCGWTFVALSGVGVVIFLGRVAYDLLHTH
jgi:hypothetical protein